MTFMSIILAQYAFTQYGTYVMFSWDIMEPVTAMMSLSDAIVGYWFWLLKGKPWNLNDLRAHYYERALMKNFSKKSINYQQYQMLKRARASTLEKLTAHDDRWVDKDA